jgi:hypothetical protein
MMSDTQPRAWDGSTNTGLTGSTQPKTTKSNTMIQKKKTKSVEMYGDEQGVKLEISATIGRLLLRDGDRFPLYIPIKVVFQIKRGLESYIQKFYRKPVKK